MIKSFSQLRQNSPKFSCLGPRSSLSSFISFSCFLSSLGRGWWDSEKILLFLCQVLGGHKCGRSWAFYILICVGPPQLCLLSRSHAIGFSLQDLPKSLLLSPSRGLVSSVYVQVVGVVGREDRCTVILFLPNILSLPQIFSI